MTSPGMGFAGAGFGFTSPITGDQGQLNVPAIKSPGFISGVSGWSINRDGTVEFNNGIFRGHVDVASLTAASIGNSDIGNSTFHDGVITRTEIVFDTSGGETLIYANTVTSQTFLATGNFTAPAGVTVLSRVQAWGPGGTGSQFGGAGGGGEYAEDDNVAVTPLTVYPATVAAGVTTQFSGNAVTTKAFPGNTATSMSGALGGNSSTSGIHFPGGKGGNGSSVSNDGGGGGSSAGPATSGNNGGNATSGAAGAGGPAVAGGGKGGNGSVSIGAQNGSAPGGGGGGCPLHQTPGNGGAGKIILTWVTSSALIGSISGVAGTDPAGNSYPAGFMGGMVAVDPVAVPQKPETVHTITVVSAGYSISGGFSYWKNPDGSIGWDLHNLVHDGVTANPDNTVLVTAANGLPTAYRPNVSKRFPVWCNLVRASGASFEMAGIEFEPDGSVQIFGMAVASTRSDGKGSFRLDTP